MLLTDSESSSSICLLYELDVGVSLVKSCLSGSLDVSISSDTFSGLTCCGNFVENSVRLFIFVSRNVISETDGCQRNKAVVQCVKSGVIAVKDGQGLEFVIQSIGDY
ncbi:hypothetical protein BpHYR1_004442 [Brachionus plicatilis]|uniref:Uncharacterized protein n=1 Tax=Brachionus plicatilis TaxID=10195 RepID=A0A3M7RNT8_BRAPC|nr:hypothetical protein BpHYR1_004442 [Brachionus plicatilis]